MQGLPWHLQRWPSLRQVRLPRLELTGLCYISASPSGVVAARCTPKFGFRIEQIRMAGNSGAPDAGDPMQHRALIGWQMDGFHGIRASDMKVELGSHVTYDVTHGAFGMSRTFGAFGSRPAATNRTEPATASKPFSLRLFEPSPAAREPFRQTNESVSMAHEIAAAGDRQPSSWRGRPRYRRESAPSRVRPPCARITKLAPGYGLPGPAHCRALCRPPPAPARRRATPR